MKGVEERFGPPVVARCDGPADLKVADHALDMVSLARRVGSGLEAEWGQTSEPVHNFLRVLMFWRGIFNIALGLAGLWLLTLVSCDGDARTASPVEDIGAVRPHL